MVHVFRSASSTGARELAEAIGGRRWRLERHRSAVRQGDVVVCWGEAAPPVPQGVRVINGPPIRSKFADAVRLREANVPTVQVSQTRPVQQPQAVEDPARLILTDILEDIADFEDTPFARNRPYIDGVTELRNKLTSYLQQLTQPLPPPVPLATWVGRMNNHMGGLDLLTPPPQPDYFVKKENITEEFRVHSFDGRSIRAGKKVAREGVAQHPWVRSWDGGWRIHYDGISVTQAHRDLAHQACQALGLTFGAVDIGCLQNGSLIVLEVNRAPGLEGGTVTAYANAINRMVGGS